MAPRILPALLIALLAACGGDSGTDLLHPQDCDDATEACLVEAREPNGPDPAQCSSEGTACLERLPDETVAAWRACQMQTSECCRQMDCRMTTACGDQLDACVESIPPVEVER